MIASNNLCWNLEKFSFAFWQYTFDYIWPNINSTFNDNNTRIIPLPLLSVDLKHFNKHKLKYSFLEVFSVLHTCENDIDMTIPFSPHSSLLHNKIPSIYHSNLLENYGNIIKGLHTEINSQIDSLNHSFPMHLFSTPENIRKPYGFLMLSAGRERVDKGSIGNEWVKRVLT